MCLPQPSSLHFGEISEMQFTSLPVVWIPIPVLALPKTPLMCNRRAGLATYLVTSGRAVQNGNPEKGARIMSAEQMRVELEFFVNRGLRKGLKGWPKKGLSGGGKRSEEMRCIMPRVAALFRGVKASSLWTERMFPSPAEVLSAADPYFGASDIQTGKEFWWRNCFRVTGARISPL